MSTNPASVSTPRDIADSNPYSTSDEVLLQAIQKAMPRRVRRKFMATLKNEHRKQQRAAARKNTT